MIELVVGPGHIVALVGPSVLGRDPGRPEHHPVNLPGAGQLVSRNHALVAPAGAEAIAVTDLGGVNGTTVLLDGHEIALRAHEPTVISVPCTIVCGDRAIDVAESGRSRSATA